MRVTFHVVSALALVLSLCSTPAFAQADFGVRGFVTVGQITFKAKESFQAILDKESGPIFGGGGQVLLPWGLYVEVGAWRFKDDGERVFIGPNDEVFRLGIPVTITVTPLEITGGYRFRVSPKIVPYAGVGYSKYRYKETSDFAEPGENVNESFAGWHVAGGVEYLPLQWLGVGVEVGLSSIKDSIGQGGVSAAFGEDDLGGTSVRLKISVGR
jgi:opacity protein-like surface antigen